MIPCVLFIIMICFLFFTIYSFIFASIYMVIFFKACASICFVLMAFFSYKRHPKDSIFFKSIFCGLIFCLFGDILITMSYIPVFFLLGIICFFICHLLFINGFCRKVPFNHKDILLFFIIYIPFTLFISINKYFSFNGYYFLVLIYSMVLTLMLSKSFSLITLEIHNKSAIYSLIISTLMFSLSDFILLFILFSPYSSSILMLLNLFTYYIGQGILALNFNKLY
ncbi:MAG: lysoplasmalogenase family protein [Clostridium sp.]|uniref:lysoplasmalogenase family protein n=2 Tax=Clostridium sp. TaxID=1506 RepID=UPI003991AAF3